MNETATSAATVLRKALISITIMKLIIVESVKPLTNIRTWSDSVSSQKCYPLRECSWSSFLLGPLGTHHQGPFYHHALSLFTMRREHAVQPRAWSTVFHGKTLESPRPAVTGRARVCR